MPGEGQSGRLRGAARSIEYGVVYYESMNSSPVPVFYLGDSHVRYFKKAARHGLLSPHEVSGLEVGGATAVGMRNPNAKTNALGRFRAWIRDKPRESVVILHLGEVDCGFVIWYRAAKYNEPAEVQMMNSLEAYFEFVDELLSLGFHAIIVTSATLPTITDDDQIGEVVVKRSSIAATQKERTDLTLRYNELLRAGANSRSLPYVDISSDIIDPKTGVVDVRLRNTNPEDHHMNPNLAAVYWGMRLHEPLAHYQRDREQAVHFRCERNTFIKAYRGHSRSLPKDMLQSVSVGAIVSGSSAHAYENYMVVRDVVVDGVSFPHLSLLHANHFSEIN